MSDLTDFCKRLTEACGRYEQTAPTVAAHCDDLYRRLGEGGRAVTVWEILQIATLWADDWMHPSYAANHVYKLRHALGMDVTGQAGF